MLKILKHVEACPLSIPGQSIVPLTGLLLVSGGSSPGLISSSLDGTCKVWNLVSGRLLQTRVFPVAVTTIAVDPGEQLLFTGSADGRIYVSTLDIRMQDNPIVVSEKNLEFYLDTSNGIHHCFSIHFWRIMVHFCIYRLQNWQPIPRSSHAKGHITNLVVIPWSSLTLMENQRNCLRPCVSLLDKVPQINLVPEGTLTLLPQYCSREDHLVATSFEASTLLDNQILDLEQGRMPEAIQMKVGTDVENRLRAVAMTKHVTAINKHLQL